MMKSALQTRFLAIASRAADNQILHLTIFRGEGEVVVQELSELHDHVCVAGVGQVLVRVVLLGHPPRVGQRPHPPTSARLLSSILQGESA